MVSCGVYSFIIEEFYGVTDSLSRLGYILPIAFVFLNRSGYTNDYRGVFPLLINYTKVIVRASVWFARMLLKRGTSADGVGRRCGERVR